MAKSVIWKYRLTSEVGDYMLLPGAKVLAVQVQHGNIVLWAQGELSKERERRRFVVVGTGIEFESNGREIFLGTVQMVDSDLVMHVFENSPKKE